MIKRIAITASLLAALAAAAQAQVPFLSFADNGTAAVTRTASTANGNGGFDSAVTGSGSGYTSFTTTSTSPLTSISYVINGPITATASSAGLQDDATLGAGSIDVTDSVLGLLFTVSFDSGELTADNLGATDFLADNVVYSNINAALASSITNNGGNAFSLSFANPLVTAGSVTYSTAGSFASQPVPEPATMAALGLGAVAMLRRRRKA